MSSLRVAPWLCLPCLQSQPHTLAHSLQAPGVQSEGESSSAQTTLGVLQTLSTQTELSLLQLMLNMAIFYQKGLSIVF